MRVNLCNATHRTRVRITDSKFKKAGSVFVKWNEIDAITLHREGGDSFALHVSAHGSLSSAVQLHGQGLIWMHQ